MLIPTVVVVVVVVGVAPAWATATVALPPGQVTVIVPVRALVLVFASTVIAIVAPGGRSVAAGKAAKMSVGGGRLQNHAGKSLSPLYARVITAEHDGLAERQSARMSQLGGAAEPAVTHGADGTTFTPQPS